MVVLLWSKPLNVAFVGYVENGLYVVDFSGKTTSSALCLFAKGDKGWLWHRRLAHVNMRTLQSLHKGGHILGLKEDVSFCKDRVCRACVQGKMHGAPHKAKTIISTTRCLELLHVDLFGPPSHESLGGKKYCLVIVDDYSRYCWVFFFKYKSETQRTMMEFANQVQRKYDTTILAIRSDNGTEFKNYTLDDFLGEEGIQHQYSSPYTPQKNGVAERKNQSFIEVARTMMMEYKSNYNFWAEAISTACHATNRLYFHKVWRRHHMRSLPVTSPMSHTSRSLDANAMCLSRTLVYPSLIQEHKKESLLDMQQTLTPIEFSTIPMGELWNLVM
jgi:transposase InsO family protein